MIASAGNATCWTALAHRRRLCRPARPRHRQRAYCCARRATAPARRGRARHGAARLSTCGNDRPRHAGRAERQVLMTDKTAFSWADLDASRSSWPETSANQQVAQSFVGGQIRVGRKCGPAPSATHSRVRWTGTQPQSCCKLQYALLDCSARNAEAVEQLGPWP